MSLVDTITLIFVLAAASLSFRNWRGLLWLSALLLDYVISTAYWRSGLTNPELATGLCDAAVCVAIFFIGKSIWELRVWTVFMVSLVTNFVYLASNISGANFIDHDIYSSIEEVLNAVAVFVIAFASGALISGDIDGRSFDPWIFGGRAFLLARRQAHHHEKNGQG